MYPFKYINALLYLSEEELNSHNKRFNTSYKIGGHIKSTSYESSFFIYDEEVIYLINKLLENDSYILISKGIINIKAINTLEIKREEYLIYGIDLLPLKVSEIEFMNIKELVNRLYPIDEKEYINLDNIEFIYPLDIKVIEEINNRRINPINWGIELGLGITYDPVYIIKGTNVFDDKAINLISELDINWLTPESSNWIPTESSDCPQGKYLGLSTGILKIEEISNIRPFTSKNLELGLSIQLRTAEGLFFVYGEEMEVLSNFD